MSMEMLWLLILLMLACVNMLDVCFGILVSHYRQKAHWPIRLSGQVVHLIKGGE